MNLRFYLYTAISIRARREGLYMETPKRLRSFLAISCEFFPAK